MKCKNYKTRTKTIKGKRTIYNYCTVLKQVITYDNCRNCAKKEFKIPKSTIFKKNSANYRLPVKRKPIKGKKHKLTKATEISMKIKRIVWERDDHKCIYCHTEVTVEYANSHYIKRSQLGKGIPENVVTACPICHDKYDFGVNIESMINYTKEYLQSKYEDWNEENLVYKKRG